MNALYWAIKIILYIAIILLGVAALFLGLSIVATVILLLLGLGSIWLGINVGGFFGGIFVLLGIAYYVVIGRVIWEELIDEKRSEPTGEGESAHSRSKVKLSNKNNDIKLVKGMVKKYKTKFNPLNEPMFRSKPRSSKEYIYNPKEFRQDNRKMNESGEDESEK
jgi:hypothetical protein